MGMKDLFSGHAELYATFRPTYPEELFHYILSLVKENNCAWDCATGNGQVAVRLAQDFTHVCASDISGQQIKNAFAAGNVEYTVQPAENTNFAEESFDLITVAQALHWIDLAKFYKEVTRVGKKGAVLAVWGYSNITVTPAIDEHIFHLYTNLVGKYWDHARRLVEEEYASLEFPFDDVTTPKFTISAQWSLQHLSGYLQSWSATQAYIRATGKDPVPNVISEIAKHFEESEKREIRFPIFTKIGRIG